MSQNNTVGAVAKLWPVAKRILTSAPVVWAAGGAVVSYGNAPTAAFCTFCAVAIVKLYEAVTSRTLGLPEGLYSSADIVGAVSTGIKAVETHSSKDWVLASSFGIGAVAMAVNAANIVCRRQPKFIVDRPDFYNSIGNSLMMLFQGSPAPIVLFSLAFASSVVRDIPRIKNCFSGKISGWANDITQPSLLNGGGWVFATFINTYQGHYQFALATLLWGMGYVMDPNFGANAASSLVKRVCSQLGARAEPT